MIGLSILYGAHVRCASLSMPATASTARKLTLADARDIRAYAFAHRDRPAPELRLYLAETYGVSEQWIRSVLSGATWPEGGGFSGNDLRSEIGHLVPVAPPHVAPPVVPSPCNDDHHRRVRDQQLALIEAYLGRPLRRVLSAVAVLLLLAVPASAQAKEWHSYCVEWPAINQLPWNPLEDAEVPLWICGPPDGTALPFELYRNGIKVDVGASRLTQTQWIVNGPVAPDLGLVPYVASLPVRIPKGTQQLEVRYGRQRVTLTWLGSVCSKTLTEKDPPAPRGAPEIFCK